MLSSDTVFVLGASDPEMAAIEALVTAHGYQVAYATHKGRRVWPAAAYQADGLLEGRCVDS